MASKALSGSSKRLLLQIADEHRHLWETLTQVEQATDLTVLMPRLKVLREHLDLHFAEEEASGGLADAVGESTTRHQRQLEQLFEEHKNMLATVSDIMERSQAILDGPKAQILSDVRQLGQDLRTHERTETGLLMDSVLSDIGSGD